MQLALRESTVTMKLVVAEKPSVGRAIAAAVGAKERKDGYIEGSGWAVTWCHGHLVDLAEPESYPGWAGKWDEAKLPMLPAEWLWEASKEKGAASQLKAVERLMARRDLEVVYNACDADREGEGIFRRVYAHARCGRPVLRFWSTSLVEDAVLKDLAAAAPSERYDGLGDAAEGRAKADWLVGLNATRAYTCLYDRVITVGRVQTPVLAMVAERTRAAASFEPRCYWQARLACAGGAVLAGERRGTEQEAEDEAAAATRAGAVEVTAAEYRDAREKAPALFDLTALQRAASEKLGLTAEQTLATMQKLYEGKLLTYPRTDSRYITSDDSLEAATVLAQVACSGIAGEEACAAFDADAADIGQVVDDGKVAGHGAVMPTRLMTARALAGLDADAAGICRLVVTRLMAATMPPAVRRKARIGAVCREDGTLFTARSSAVVEASWLAVDLASMKKADGKAEGENSEGAGEGTRPLPEGIAAGDLLAVEGTEVHKGQTAPPKNYTDSTLLSAMENCGKRMSDRELAAAINDDTSHSGGLGTPATRASIIEKLVRRGYIARKGRSLVATDAGLAVVDTVNDGLKSPELTARWEKALADIEHGEGDLATFMGGIERYTAEVVDAARSGCTAQRRAEAARRIEGRGPKPVEGCKCPRCGKPVVEGKWKYACSSNRYEKGDDGKWRVVDGCGWAVWAKVAGKKLTKRQAATAISGGTCEVSGFKSKAGKRFAAKVRLGEDADGNPRFDLVFDSGKAGGGSGGNRGGGRELEGCSCPVCGAAVTEGKWKYSCSSNRYEKGADGKWRVVDGCGWEVWVKVAGRRVAREEAAELIGGGRVHLDGLTSKAGKTFEADARLSEDGSRFELLFD